MATHYEVLGVAPGATHDEIRRAYYGLARRYHPDAHSQSSTAVQGAARRLMVSINASWAVLGDPEQRRRYDAEIAPRLRTRPPAPPEAPTAGGQRARRHDMPGWLHPDAPGEPGDPDEADEDVPAYRMEEDPDDGSRGPADVIVLVPIALGALAVVTFCFSLVLQSTALFSLSLLLVPLTLASFLATPFAIMATKMRSGSRQ